MPRSSILLIALLASPLALAVGTGPTYPDDPHNPAPRPGVDSTLNPIEKPMPRDTDARLPGDEPENPPATQNDERDLPGMGSGEAPPPRAPVGTTNQR